MADRGSPLSLLHLDETYSGVPLQPNREEALETRVIGKICPRCGKPGSIVYQTKERIVFECPNGHQFEMKRRKNRNTGKSLA
jgi:lysyl-tRNA synthetase class I